MEKLKNHNNLIEEKYLEHELTKFKDTINLIRTKQLVEISAHNIAQPRSNIQCELAEWNNNQLSKNLENGHASVEDFYKVASSQEVFICNNKECNTLFSTNIILNESNNTLNEVPKSVRFEHDNEFIDETEINVYHERSLNDMNGSSVSEESIVNEDISNNYNKSLLSIQLTPKKVDGKQITKQLELVGKHIEIEAQSEQNILMPENEFVNIKKLLKITDETESKDCKSNNDEICQSLTITKFNLIDDTIDKTISAIKTPICLDSGKKLHTEQESIIADLFQKNNESKGMQKIILQKYFLKWLRFTTIEKLSTQNMLTNESRTRKIESFLKNIRIEKKKIASRPIFTDEVASHGESKKVQADNILMARKYHNKYI